MKTHLHFERLNTCLCVYLLAVLNAACTHLMSVLVSPLYLCNQPSYFSPCSPNHPPASFPLPKAPQSVSSQNITNAFESHSTPQFLICRFYLRTNFHWFTWLTVSESLSLIAPRYTSVICLRSTSIISSCSRRNSLKYMMSLAKRSPRDSARGRSSHKESSICKIILEFIFHPINVMSIDWKPSKHHDHKTKA